MKSQGLLIKKIKDLSEKFYSKILSIRRHIHQNPELSFQEKNTAEYICKILEENNISYYPNIGGTYGIIAEIDGESNTLGNSKTIALRADIDALPIIEENDFDYKSNNSGVMHACGHDAHTASLLGAAMILNELKSEFGGKVVLIFQAAEEELPGGAISILESDKFKELNPSIIFGQHIMPDIRCGEVAFCPGPFFSSGDEIKLTVSGKGGHAAHPEKLTDPVVIASHLITALQQVISRKKPPHVASILSFGKIIADGASNIIPDAVYIEGTFRSLDEKWRSSAHKEISNISKNLCKSMGGECEVNIINGYPVLLNDVNLSHASIDYAKVFLGEENVKIITPKLYAEDFAYYSQKIPSSFYALGARLADGNSSALHTSTLNIDENSLKVGMGLMAWNALQSL